MKSRLTISEFFEALKLEASGNCITCHDPLPRKHKYCCNQICLERASLLYRENKVKEIMADTSVSWKIRYGRYINTKHWQSLRERKLQAGGNMCNRCERMEAILHVHHLNYRNWFDVTLDDLEVLCETCHNSHHLTTS